MTLRTWIQKRVRRLSCDHKHTDSDEYSHRLPTTYWDDNGEYQPYFEGVEHRCQRCGKRWTTDVVPYRYYIDRNRNLIRKVPKEP